MGEQRQSVEKLFGDALFMEPEARGAFLDAACRDKPELKHLVEEMLMEGERAGSFLEKPPFDFPAKAGIHTQTTPLTPGTRLGPYEILALVGAGWNGRGVSRAGYAPGARGRYQNSIDSSFDRS
jgi:eukaryotic-like serine/threonine-protein kinase